MNYLQFVLRASKPQYGKRCDFCDKIGGVVRFEMLHEGVQLQCFQACDACCTQGVNSKVQFKDPYESVFEVEARRKRVFASRKLEQDLAKLVGGRAQPGSGNSRVHGYKGDVRVRGEWRIEHKNTSSLHSWLFKLVDMAKIMGIAADVGEKPALVIEFVRARQSFVIVPLSLFEGIFHGTD